MRRAWKGALWVLVIMIFVPRHMEAVALAVPSSRTPNYHWQQAPDIEISAYKNATDQSSLEVVEVFNRGSTLVDLTQWRLAVCDADCTKPVESQLIGRASGLTGMLEPYRHALISIGAQVAIDGYSYRTNWSKEPDFTQVKTVRLVPPNKSISTEAYMYKDLKAQTLSGGSVWRRNTGRGSGYVGSTFYETRLKEPGGSVNLYDDGLYTPPATYSGALEIVEVYPYAVDCSPQEKISNTYCHDFVKIYNNSNQPIRLYDYALRNDGSGGRRTEASTYLFREQTVIQPRSYEVVDLNGAGEPLNLANGGGYVWFEPRWGGNRFGVVRYEGASATKQGYSWMKLSQGVWDWTTTVSVAGPSPYTPISKPHDTEDCPAGKYRNPETGRCRNIGEAISALAACDEGYERNPLTNRCRKIVTKSAPGLAPCKEGQERNPLTNRCRSIASAVAELLPCDEGYERNPVTHRCRKVASSSMPKASHPVLPYKQSSQQSLMSWLVGGGIGLAVVGYGVWEWRREIGGVLRRIVTFGRR